MPAILKGWMDRIFVYGRMYRSVMRYDKGICAGKMEPSNSAGPCWFSQSLCLFL